MQPTLRTERLVLSPPTLDDVSAITDACQDPEIRSWTPLPFPYTADHAVAFVHAAAEHAGADHGYEWAVREDDALVGMVSLSRRGPGAAEIGFWTAPKARKRGLLTEAARAVIDHGFELTGLALDRLEWNGAVGNVASAKAARTLGFRYEGVRRSAFVTSAGRCDAWTAARLYSDSPKSAPWPVL